LGFLLCACIFVRAVARQRARHPPTPAPRPSPRRVDSFAAHPPPPPAPPPPGRRRREYAPPRRNPDPVQPGPVRPAGTAVPASAAPPRALLPRPFKFKAIRVWPGRVVGPGRLGPLSTDGADSDGLAAGSWPGRPVFFGRLVASSLVRAGSPSRVFKLAAS
jgi:hypothetical protein